MELSLSDIVARRSALTSSDVITVALAVAAELTDNSTSEPRRPLREHVLVSSAGEIVVTGHDLSIAPGSEAAWLAELIHDLLGLEGAGADRQPVSGGLLLLLARALGHISLPPPIYPEFLHGLARFGSADGRSLAAIYAHCVATVPTVLVPISPLEEFPTEPSIAEPVDPLPVDAAMTELGREIRQTERRLFEPLGTPPAGAFRGARRLAVAAGVAAIAVSALALSAWRTETPSSAAPEARPGPSTSADESRDAERPREDANTVDWAAAVSEAGLSDSPPAGAAAAMPALPVDVSTDPVSSVAITRAPAGPTATDRITASPDGRWVAFVSEREGTSAVYVATHDSPGARNISGAGRASTPTWSPDGRRLMFLKAEPTGSGVWNLWLSDLNRSAPTRLTSHTVGQPRDAAWFPGGDRIAYGVDDTLVIADVNGGRSHRVKSPATPSIVRTPAVSPDSTRIAFQVLRDGMWTYDLVSGEFRRILADSTAEPFAWSPDGQRIVYRALADGRWSVLQTPIREDGGASSAAAALE